MRFGFCLLVLGLAASAGGQYHSAYGYSYSNPLSASVSTSLWHSVNSRLIWVHALKRKGYTSSQLDGLSLDQLKQAYESGKVAGTKPAARPTPGPAKPPATRFMPNGRRILMPTIVNALTTDKAHRTVLKSLFMQGFREYEAAVKPQGLDNDIAGAVAFFAGAAFKLQDGVAPPEAGLDRLAKATQIALDTDRVRGISNAEKQKFYEFFVTMGTYLLSSDGALTEEADQETRAGLRDAAAGVLKKFLKIDPAKLRLTDSGFTPR